MKRITVFGRTGAGKSTLANKIFGSETFKEGHGIFSQTDQTEQKTFDWPKLPAGQLKVSWVDTPGFADNRPDTSNSKIISNILDLLRTLKDGINVALFCLPAKNRIDNEDLEEIKLMETTLGTGVFQNTWIVVTQINLFQDEAKSTYYRKYRDELPDILKNANINIPAGRVLFADFDDFDRFMTDLDDILMKSQPYYPNYCQVLDSQEKRGRDFMHTNEMHSILKKFLEKFTETEQEILKSLEQLKQKPTSFNQRQMKQKEADLQQIRQKIEDFRSMIQEPRTIWDNLKRYGLLQDLEDTSINLTVVESGKKSSKIHKREDHPHGTDNGKETKLIWRIALEYNCLSFKYSFRRCWSNSCLILTVSARKPKETDMSDISFIDLSGSKLVVDDGNPFCELMCELDFLESTFKISKGKNQLKSISFAK